MKFFYINLTKEIPPRDKIYLDGFRKNGVEIEEYIDNSEALKKFWRIFKKHHAIAGNYDLMLVGYTAHILVPFARLISRKKIIFNALGSLYEGIIVSRGQGSPFSLRGIYCWLVDFLAFHCASLSLVESNEQKKYIARKFFVNEKKLLRAWTGADDNAFFYDSAIKKLSTFTVLFRGGFLPESGIEYALEAAKILENEDINFRIIGWGMLERKVEEMIKKLELKNVEWIRKKLPLEELRVKMQECHLSLGQLSDHERLGRTIPHKAFESIAMKLPYLTARNKAVLELLTEKEMCFCGNPADAQDLAKKILEIKNNQSLADKIAENAYWFFNKSLTPKFLASEPLKILSK
jgi:glycosyltransferase involved in cell wall biosynthesis